MYINFLMFTNIYVCSLLHTKEYIIVWFTGKTSELICSVNELLEPLNYTSGK